MPTANINGVDLNYEVSGQGKELVLVHGYIGSARDWENQITVLSRKYRVVALDHPGHGKSAAPSREEDYSIPIFANNVYGLLKLLDIEKCCLMGHSMGGMTALQFSLEHQDMLAALVLVDTSSEFVGSSIPPDLREKLDEVARSRGNEAALEYHTANNPQRALLFKEHPEQEEASRKRHRMTSVDGYIYAWKAMDKWEPVTSRLSEIKVPTIIYWGDEDILLTDGAQTLKKGIVNSELVTAEGAGHYPHVDAPGVFNETLLKFLERANW